MQFEDVVAYLKENKGEFDPYFFFGSRFTCDTYPETSDYDIAYLPTRRTSLAKFLDGLNVYRKEGQEAYEGAPFNSYYVQLDDGLEVNLVVFNDRDDFYNHARATFICKAFNFESRDDRILVFDAVRSSIDEKLTILR